MPDVYVITSGEYSDYSIDAVYSTRAMAEEALPAFSGSYGDKPDIEEWELDPAEPLAAVRRGLLSFHVASRKHSIEVRSVDHLGIAIPDRPDNKLVYEFRDQPGVLTTTVITSDIAHATKIAADRFRQHIAAVGWSKDAEKVKPEDPWPLHGPPKAKEADDA